MVASWNRVTKNDRLMRRCVCDDDGDFDGGFGDDGDGGGRALPALEQARNPQNEGSDFR